MATMPASWSERTLAERFAYAIEDGKLPELDVALEQVGFLVGQVATALRLADEALRKTALDKDSFEEERFVYRVPEQRSELPTLTLEMVGRLDVFATDVERVAQELGRDVQRIRKLSVSAYHGSNIADEEWEKRGDDA